MKNYEALWGSISILIGAVISILAFTRNGWQTWLLLGVFTLWAVWVLLVMLHPYMEQAKRCRERQKLLQKKQAQGISKTVIQIPDIKKEPVETLLLRHVNYRISAYLHATYPEARWEWCEKTPAQLVIQGGTGRIRVYGIPDFNYADVAVDGQANIHCSMVKIVPFAQLQNGGKGEELPPNKQPVDPQIWYEVQGRKVLENLIADLHSRGHSSLTLYENGDICIRQADKEETQETFQTFPERVYWPRLAQVLEQEGLAAQVQETGIQVSW